MLEAATGFEPVAGESAKCADNSQRNKPFPEVSLFHSETSITVLQTVAL